VAKALPETRRRSLESPERVRHQRRLLPDGLELKGLPTDQTNLYNDVFDEDLEANPAPGQGSRPGLLAFRGWGLERQLGPDRRALVEALRADIETMRKALPEKFAYVHGVRDLPGRPAENLKVNLRGSPFAR
jgi:hypothetical protein